MCSFVLFGDVSSELPSRFGAVIRAVQSTTHRLELYLIRKLRDLIS